MSDHHRARRLLGRPLIAAAPLAAVLLLVAFSCHFLRHQDEQSSEVQRELRDALDRSRDADDPSFAALTDALRTQSLESSGELLDELPTTEGVVMESVQLDPGGTAVVLVYRGVDRATGWCFHATIDAGHDPVPVRRERC